MKQKKYIIIAIFLTFLTAAQAQNSLEIEKAFQQYGKSKGVTMVQLKNKNFGNYNFSLFKSLTVKNNPQAKAFLIKCLTTDQKGAKKVKQVIVSGTTQSLFLELSKKGELYRMILFNNSPSQPTTLVYIESANNADDILKYILNKQ